MCDITDGIFSKKEISQDPQTWPKPIIGEGGMDLSPYKPKCNAQKNGKAQPIIYDYGTSLGGLDDGDDWDKPLKHLKREP